MEDWLAIVANSPCAVAEYGLSPPRMAGLVPDVSLWEIMPLRAVEAFKKA